MTFDNAAAHADLEFVAETGSAKVGIAELEAVYNRSTAQMSDEALRLSIAQERLNRTIGRSGPESTAAKSATLALRREQASLASEEHRVAAAASSSSRAIQRETHEVGQLTRGAAIGSGVLRGFGRAAVYAGGGLLATAGATRLIKTAINDATNLHAQIHKTSVEFAGSTNDVLRWSKTTAEGIGLARSKSLQFASSIGGILRPLGVLPVDAAKISTTLTQLSGDLAALYNTDIQTTFTALQNGLVGQARGAKKFGIDLTAARVNEIALIQSHKQHTNELTSQEKVLARYTIIMRDTKLAQGDFARQSDTLANQEKILSANLHDTSEAIGTQLYPSINKLIHRTNDWLGQGKNQARIQRDVSQAIKDGTQIVHGLADAEKLIAPPIHATVQALGGLRHAVEVALVLGVVAKAKRAATSMGLIQAASARARTQIVADSVVEERALVTVGAQAQRTSALVARIGAYTGAGGGGGIVPVGKGGLLKGGLGGRLGGAALLAAILGPSFLPQGRVAGNLQGAGTAALLGFTVGGAPGAIIGAGGYELAKGGASLSDFLGSTSLGSKFGIGNTPKLKPAELVALIKKADAAGKSVDDSFQALRQLYQFGLIDDRAAKAGLGELKRISSGQKPFLDASGLPKPASRTGIPTRVDGRYRNPHYLSPAAQRDIALHENPNDLGALRAQRDSDDRAIAFLKKRYAAQKVSGPEYRDQFIKLTDDRHQQQSQIDQINQAAAAAAATAAGKAEALRLRRLHTQESVLRTALKTSHDSKDARDKLVAYLRQEKHDSTITAADRAGFGADLATELERETRVDDAKATKAATAYASGVSTRRKKLENVVAAAAAGGTKAIAPRGAPAAQSAPASSGGQEQDGTTGPILPPRLDLVRFRAAYEKLIAADRRDSHDKKLTAAKRAEYAAAALADQKSETAAIADANKKWHTAMRAAKTAYAARQDRQYSLGDAILGNALTDAQAAVTAAGTNETKIAAAYNTEIAIYRSILQRQKARAEKLKGAGNEIAYQQALGDVKTTEGNIAGVKTTIAQQGKQARADQVSLGDQLLQNALSLAQLRETQAGTNAAKIKKAQAAELQVYNAILRRQREHEKGLSGLALAQAQADVIATRATITQLRQQTKTPVDRGANERQFLSSFRDIVRAYAPNAFPGDLAATTAGARAKQHAARAAIKPAAATAGRPFYADLTAELELTRRPRHAAAERAAASQPRSNKTDTHLYEAVHELRQIKGHLSVLTGQARTPGSRFASEAALAASG